MVRKVLNGLDLNAQRITNLGAGSGPNDAVVVSQLDSVARSLDWKPEVIAAATGNVTLTSPGSVFDGVTVTAGMQTIPNIGTVTRILLLNQTAPAENGIYDWNGAAAAMTRSVDADSATELSGSTVTIQRGATYGDRVYRVTTDDPITLGTTAITLAQVGGAGSTYVGGNGLLLTGSTFDVGAGTGITVAADSVAVDTTVVVRKFAVNVGNGAATSIAVTHNLGTRDVTVAVFDNTTFEEVLPDVVHTDANNVTLGFATAPASNAYRCVVHG